VRTPLSEFFEVGFPLREISLRALGILLQMLLDRIGEYADVIGALGSGQIPEMLGESLFS
jgi:hypothetical protein